MIRYSVTDCVSNDSWPKEMADRLRSAAGAKGISSAKQLHAACSAAGLDVTMAFCRNVWYGANPPITTNVAAMLDLIGLSFDEYVWGREPKKLTKDDLLAVVAGMIEETGGKIPSDDPDIVRAAQLLMKIKDGEKKKAVVRMLEAFIGDTA